jgi:hypothetical protein
MQVTYDCPVGSDVPALWEVDVWPMVRFEGRVAFLGPLQQWLCQETMRIFLFVTSGDWPQLSSPVPEPEWAVLPPWGIQP